MLIVQIKSGPKPCDNTNVTDGWVPGKTHQVANTSRIVQDLRTTLYHSNGSFVAFPQCCTPKFVYLSKKMV